MVNSFDGVYKLTNHVFPRGGSLESGDYVCSSCLEASVNLSQDGTSCQASIPELLLVNPPCSNNVSHPWCQQKRTLEEVACLHSMCFSY